MRAERVFHDLIFMLKKVTVFYQFDIFYYGLFNLRPLLLLRTLRRKREVIRAPAPISVNQRKMYAVKFVLSASKNSKNVLSVDKLLANFFDIYSGVRNSAMEKKLYLYKEVLDNRMYVKRIVRFKR